MIAIPVAAFMGSRAMILGQTPQTRCNDFGHGGPMIAIPGADDCDPVHVGYLTWALTRHQRLGPNVAGLGDGRHKSATMPILTVGSCA